METYRAPGQRCLRRGFNCDALVLGALTKGWMTLKSTESPYRGVSLRFLTEHILKLPLPSLCSINKDSFDSGTRKRECCEIKDELESTIDSLKSRVYKLDLWGFAEKSEQVAGSADTS